MQTVLSHMFLGLGSAIDLLGINFIALSVCYPLENIYLVQDNTDGTRM